MALPPGPRAPAAIQAAAFLHDPLGFLARCAGRHGDPFLARFPGLGDVVYVAGRDEVRRIYTGSPARYHAGAANARWLEPVLGRRSLLTLDEDEHLRHRRLVLPPFHGERVQAHARAFADAAEAEIAGWPVERPFALLAGMRRITLRVILRTVMGVRDPGRRARFAAAILALDRASGLVVPVPPLRRDLGGRSPWRRFLAARATVHRLLDAEIAARRADPGATDRDDVLSLLVAARDADGGALTDEELRDELLTLLSAGYETTSTALGWLFERVLRTPRVHERLGDAPDDDAYLDAVVSETLRLRGPLTDSTRVVTVPTDVAGHVLAPGTLLVVALPLVHTRASDWPEPRGFRPERFLLGAKPAPYAFLPFGGGVRRCIGASFALLEMRVVARAVLERVRLRPADPAAERGRLHHVVVVPARGARVVVTGRRGRPRPAAARSASPA